jgi:hypothetical protein
MKSSREIPVFKTGFIVLLNWNRYIYCNIYCNNSRSGVHVGFCKWEIATVRSLGELQLVIL